VLQAGNVDIEKLIVDTKAIEKKWEDVKLGQLIDRNCERIFDHFLRVTPRIENYFKIVNCQIDQVYRKDGGGGGDMGLKYPTILGRIPKYAVKEVVQNHLFIRENETL
jgi:hypothetical protein